MSIGADKPLFESAHQALLFAYSFAGTHYGAAGAAERSIAAFGRSRYELEARPSERGLRGLDGAAQAAMIKAIVERQPPANQVYVIARFARLNRRARELSMQALAVLNRRAGGVEIPIDVAAELAQVYYGAPRKFVHLAERADLKPGQVIRMWKAFRAAMREGERVAMAAVEVALERAGIIEMQVESNEVADA